ncbi:MAG: alpha/beta fold hydrolase [Gemmatimonadota bacterium]
MGRELHRAPARARRLLSLQRGVRLAALAALLAFAGCRTDVATAIVEEPVRVRTEEGFELAGTLVRPALPARAGRTPVVLLIGGSGPQDRDGARVELAGYFPFRDLAGALAAAGIATLRLDDRGTGASSGRFAGATTRDFARDAGAALRWLRGRSDLDGTHAAVLGHSEGALVALLAAESDSLIAALVLLGAPSRPGRELARWQRDAFVSADPATYPPERRAAVLSEAETVADRAAEGDPWLREWFALDPRTIARATRAPALLLHGENDRQVPVQQAEELARVLERRVQGPSVGAGTRAAGAALPWVTLKRFASTNHLFLEDYDGDPRGYARLASRRVRDDVSDAIVTWLAMRFHTVR